MSVIKAAITGVAGYVPDDILSNADLEKMVDTNDEWIVSRTGIRERRILKDPKKAAAYMGAECVRDLLAKTNTDPDDVDLLICATVTPDMMFPNTASLILEQVGMRNSYGFDLNAACSGFLFGLTTAAQFIKSGKHKKVILVGSDKMSAITDFTDRNTCILFGDGAGAVMLEPSEEFGFEDSIMFTNADGKEYLNLKGGGSLNPATEETLEDGWHYLFQDGRPVFKAAVKGMATVSKKLMDKAGVPLDQIDWMVPHQANLRILTAVADMLKFDQEKVMVVIDKYGNTTDATIPLSLWDYEKKLKKGDKLLFTAFGGSYTWGAIYLTWAYDGIK
jgi:3-oxoacyl-[acyl-carrier-protein] synthase-3